MDTKIAYCCLHCSDQKNCCGPCGECEACCKDCGDTSACKSTAFLDKDDNFYLKWQGTNSTQGAGTNFHFDYAYCIDHSVSNTSNSNSEFDSDGNCKISYFSNTVYSKQCCECDCPQNPGGIQFMYEGDEISSTFTETRGASTDPEEDPGCNGMQGFSYTETGGGYGCPGPSEQNEKVNTETTVCQYEEEYHSEQNCLTTTINSSSKATVTWNTSLTLYDSEGNPVANPWSMLPAPDPYDPLNPIRVVNAPGCHFFHT